MFLGDICINRVLLLDEAFTHCLSLQCVLCLYGDSPIHCFGILAFYRMSAYGDVLIHTGWSLCVLMIQSTSMFLVKLVFLPYRIVTGDCQMHQLLFVFYLYWQHLLCQYGLIWSPNQFIYISRQGMFLVVVCPSKFIPWAIHCVSANVTTFNL